MNKSLIYKVWKKASLNQRRNSKRCQLVLAFIISSGGIIQILNNWIGGFLTYRKMLVKKMMAIFKQKIIVIELKKDLFIQISYITQLILNFLKVLLNFQVILKAGVIFTLKLIDFLIFSI